MTRSAEAMGDPIRVSRRKIKWTSQGEDHLSWMKTAHQRRLRIRISHFGFASFLDFDVIPEFVPLKLSIVNFGRRDDYNCGECP